MADTNKKKCRIDGCEGDAASQGYCSRCYQREVAYPKRQARKNAVKGAVIPAQAGILKSAILQGDTPPRQYSAAG